MVKEVTQKLVGIVNYVGVKMEKKEKSWTFQNIISSKREHLV